YLREKKRAYLNVKKDKFILLKVDKRTKTMYFSSKSQPYIHSTNLIDDNHYLPGSARDNLCLAFFSCLCCFPIGLAALIRSIQSYELLSQHNAVYWPGLAEYYGRESFRLSILAILFGFLRCLGCLGVLGYLGALVCLGCLGVLDFWYVWVFWDIWVFWDVWDVLRK
ncbi:unnamed protein product, partial [Didymodactylos carnosus]